MLKEGKLKLVEPSEAIKESYIKKSESNLASAKILLEHDKLEEAISMAYYSMYSILTALLFKTGIKCENHSASILLLKKVFEIENYSINDAKRERIDKQYYAGFSIAKQDVNDTIQAAENFNNKMLDFISRLGSQKIKAYRKRFENIMSKN